MFENVRGMLDRAFDDYREFIELRLRKNGYVVCWNLLNASDFGVPQLRPRVVMVGLKRVYVDDLDLAFQAIKPPTVGQTLKDLMAANGWEGASSWAKQADRVAPTLVGGSKKHGGPDLGPTRARKAWSELGVEGRTLADDNPDPGHSGIAAD